LGSILNKFIVPKKLNADESVQQELIYLLAETEKIVALSYCNVLSRN
jgi:hypothetical protein